MHDIRLRVESGENLYNSVLSPNGYLQVDQNKYINVRFIFIAGRTPEVDYNESDVRYLYGREQNDVTLYSWDAWIRRLCRN